jgi:putative transposase
MSRLARLVVPGLPHHVTQRGNGRQRVFFEEGDYALYLRLLTENCRAEGVEIWAYGLMPNHIHLILVPESEDGLRAALAPTHRAYAGTINARRKRTGHFWQGRYGCAVMDEDHLAAAFRYILRNPVEAKLASAPDKWKWSSARAYLRGDNDGTTTTRPLRSRFTDLRGLLLGEMDSIDDIIVRDDEAIGRPLGNAAFLKALEKKTGRTLTPGRRGPKPRKKKAVKRSK